MSQFSADFYNLGANNYDIDMKIPAIQYSDVIMGKLMA
jgi:hypothetical protein